MAGPGKAGVMKIAVTSKGKTLGSPMDPAFGRAKGFIIVDAESCDFEFVDNAQNVNSAQGAGIQAARIVAERGVGCVISGHCGPKAFRALSAAGIEIIVGVDGTVEEAVGKFRRGELSPVDEADVEAHWV
jgi:predicted Fe-Mo cluster-binding NifX family protein